MSEAQPVHPYCLCTTVSGEALRVLLESTGRGKYRDTHPWLAAEKMFRAARDAGERVALLFATGQPSTFSHWGFVEEIDVLELHRATWETVLGFTPLAPVNPIWTGLDTVFLKPSAEQLFREEREGIHQHRYPLTEGEVHPYAICETPGFLINAQTRGEQPPGAGT